MACKHEVVARVARAMAMVTKRAIVSNRVKAINNHNKMTATKATTVTTMTTAIKTTMTMATLTMLTKTATKMKTTTVWRWPLVVAGGGGRGQRRQPWRGLSVHFFFETEF